MNNSAAILKALIMYAICIPLAILVGYVVVSLANAPNFSNLVLIGVIGVVALLLCAPVLLRWHHPLLVLSWGLPVTLFFLPGGPPVFLPVLALSLGISVLQRAIDKKKRFISAPQIAIPLLCMVLVVLVTAKMTGGFGLRALGNSVMGGRKYVFLLAWITGYFALTARRIPPEKAGLYVALFFLGGCLSIMGDLVAFIPRSLGFIFYLFPPDPDYFAFGTIQRFYGASTMSTAVFTFMLARYGIKGIFRAGKPWRAAVFILFVMLSCFGGFRSVLLSYALLFSILFFLEGMHRTQLLPILAFAGLMAVVICIPMVDKMPRSVQRALSFLPVNVDSAVRGDAQASLDWRLNMWMALLPQVPPHLLLGKGYAITPEDLEVMGRDSAFRKAIDPGEQALALSTDYHSGPLSVILPFGIWGAIAFLWFLAASIWALNRNRLHGDPALQTINTFLFGAFLAKTIYFMVIFGALSDTIGVFTGYLGLSICLNGGICRRPARQPATTTDDIPAHIPVRPRLQPAFHR
jgi:hypothetical protein